MFTIEQLYGPQPEPGAPNLLDPAQVPDASSPFAHASPRPISLEPGSAIRMASVPAVKANPMFWLVVTLGAGIVLVAFGTGRL